MVPVCSRIDRLFAKLRKQLAELTVKYISSIRFSSQVPKWPRMSSDRSPPLKIYGTTV